MSKAVYVGINKTAHKANKLYVGVNGVARKVKKAYVGVNGVARLFYSADIFSYTGEYSVSQVEIDGATFNLYTLTSSGTLTLGEDARYWMCGGGGKGGNGSVGGFDANGNQTTDFSVITYIHASSGEGGNGGYAKDGGITAGEWAVIVGAADGASSITAVGGDTLSSTGTVNSFKGGTGGGERGILKITYPDGVLTRQTLTMRGDGINKKPFGINSLKAHCAGGGAGTLVHEYNDTQLYVVTGGAGGSNGANGGSASNPMLVTPASDTTQYAGGTGGVYGGGNGGATSRKYNGSGSKATFYGGGGGGSGIIQHGVNSVAYSSLHGGAGYQGVVYILMPA